MFGFIKKSKDRIKLTLTLLVIRYGGGRTLGMSWPVELGRVEMSPFVTGYIGRQRWGATLRRYFLSSRGVAILVSPDTSLFVSINDGVNPNKLCLQVRMV